MSIVSKFVADYKENKVRFILEVLCLMCNFVAAGTLAWTADKPDMLMIYYIWVVASIVGGIAGYMRNSFGVTTLNIMFLIFDFIGIYKILVN